MISLQTPSAFRAQPPPAVMLFDVLPPTMLLASQCAPPPSSLCGQVTTSGT
jgi:hypothetical protein